MAKEYIDRERLIQWIEHDLSRWQESAATYKEDASGVVAMREALRELLMAPAADVVSRAEFDALIADLRAFAKQWYLEGNGFPCRFCKFSTGGGCTNDERNKSEAVCAGQFFEWRGIPDPGAKMDGGANHDL